MKKFFVKTRVQDSRIGTVFMLCDGDGKGYTVRLNAELPKADLKKLTDFINECLGYQRKGSFE